MDRPSSSQWCMLYASCHNVVSTGMCGSTDAQCLTPSLRCQCGCAKIACCESSVHVVCPYRCTVHRLRIPADHYAGNSSTGVRSHVLREGTCARSTLRKRRPFSRNIVRWSGCKRCTVGDRVPLLCYVDGDPHTAEKMVQVTFVAETGRFVFSDPLTAAVLSTGMGCVRESGAPDRFS